jgi:hypothetical protein
MHPEVDELSGTLSHNVKGKALLASVQLWIRYLYRSRKKERKKERKIYRSRKKERYTGKKERKKDIPVKSDVFATRRGWHVTHA